MRLKILVTRKSLAISQSQSISQNSDEKEQLRWSSQTPKPHTSSFINLNTVLVVRGTDVASDWLYMYLFTVIVLMLHVSLYMLN